ncbi:MAG: Uma2 family endonuclease [Saprospiraceae bacterium]|nr:Uma2 family endonuclease [Saprospiraceae bacterium]
MTRDTQVPIKRYYFNVEEFRQMGEAGIIAPGHRVELINGEIIEKSPINSLHAGTVKNLNRLLSRLLGEDAILSVQDTVELNQHSEPEPDLAILRYRKDLYTQAHPKPEDVFLIIEVADSTLEKDQKIKLPLYAATGIEEVWIINLQDNQVEVSTEPSDLGYRNCHIYRKGDAISNHLIGELAVSDVLIAEE